MIQTGAGPYRPAPFDGRRFANLAGAGAHGWAATFKFLRTHQPESWPVHAGNDPAPRPVARVDDGSIRVTVIGHSTVLVQVDGLNILTDPVLSSRIGPYSWLGIKRVRPPALALDDLPPIHVVLVSHDHFDHLDRPTLKAIDRRDAALVLTGLKAGKKNPRRKDRGTGLVGEPGHRGCDDRHLCPGGAFLGARPLRSKCEPLGRVRDPNARRPDLFRAGDTGDGPHFAAIRDRFGPMALSLLPIGAYAPRWFMAPVHVDPAEAVAASLTLKSRVSVASHFGTFALADEAIDAPPIALARAIKASEGHGARVDFRLPAFGQPIIVDGCRYSQEASA